jgi:hypothetical protein
MIWWEILIFILVVLLVIFGSITILTALVGNFWWQRTRSIEEQIQQHDAQTGPNSLLPTGSPASYLSDNNNCGGTGIQCDVMGGQSCITGKCSCVLTGSNYCPYVSLTNPGGCKRTSNDPSNCGGCGVVCASNQFCCQGSCTTFNTVQNCGSCGKTCSTGIQPGCCGGQCVDLNSNLQSCGACFNSCGTGYRCCNATCVNVMTNDNNNCGSCGRQCQGKTHCSNGTCLPGCPTGTLTCSNSTGCVDGTTDNENCGSCGNKCPTGTFCLGGSCQPNTCATGSEFCTKNGFCNGMSQVTSCGYCGNRCKLGCIQGQCTCSTNQDCGPGFACNSSGLCAPVLTCNPPLIFCPGSLSCVDPGFNPTGCGVCGNVCPSGVCSNGVCICSNDLQCPLGYVCNGSGICVLR